MSVEISTAFVSPPIGSAGGRPFSFVCKGSDNHVVEARAWRDGHELLGTEVFCKDGAQSHVKGRLHGAATSAKTGPVTRVKGWHAVPKWSRENKVYGYELWEKGTAKRPVLGQVKGQDAVDYTCPYGSVLVGVSGNSGDAVDELRFTCDWRKGGAVDCRDWHSLNTSSQCKSWCTAHSDECGRVKRAFCQNPKNVSNAHCSGDLKLEYCTQGDNFLQQPCLDFCTATTGQDHPHKERCNSLYRTKCSEAKHRDKHLCTCFRPLSDWPDIERSARLVPGAPQHPRCFVEECAQSGYKEVADGGCPECVQAVSMNATADSSLSSVQYCGRKDGSEQSSGPAVATAGGSKPSSPMAATGADNSSSPASKETASKENNSTTLVLIVLGVAIACVVAVALLVILLRSRT